MRAAALVALLCLRAPAVGAQQPTLSPYLERALSRDTTLAVWLFARPDRPLVEVEALVRRLGGRPRRRSRWLHAVSADLSTAALRRLREMSDFVHLQPVARFVAPRPAPPGAALPAPAVMADYGPSEMPYRRLHLLPLANRGFRGQGVRIAMLDTGYETSLAAFASAQVVAQRDFINDDAVVANQAGDPPGQSSHGTSTWSLLAANVPGTLIGIAPDAEYLLAKTEDIADERRTEEDNFVAALEWADSLGVDVVSTSLGYFDFPNDGFTYTRAQLDGDFAVTTRAADAAAARGIVVVASAGNDGPGAQSLGTPADGDSVIAVGAVDSLGVLAGFSSRGPTADNRIKPDLTAPGVAVWMATPGGFGRANGTSFSAPILAGAAALLRQIHPTLDPVEIRDALRGAASNRSAPNSQVGWGTPDAALAASFPRGIAVLEPTDTVLPTVTPRFRWAALDIPAYAQPVRYRLTVASDPGFTQPMLDTVLPGNEVQAPAPFRPGTQFGFRVTGETADTLTFTQVAAGRFTVPPWVRLESPAGGSVLTDPQPVFTWSSPDAASPPGPFRYDLLVFRAGSGAVVFERTGINATGFTAPEPLPRTTPLRWQVTARLGTDTATAVSAGTFTLTDAEAPPITLLYQNFPNPFPDRGSGQRATCVWFDLARPGPARLDVLDPRGHVVRNLVPGRTFGPELVAGRYGRPTPTATTGCDPDLEWDGRGNDGLLVPRGLYLIRLTTPQGTLLKRVIYLGPGV